MVSHFGRVKHQTIEEGRDIEKTSTHLLDFNNTKTVLCVVLARHCGTAD